MSRKSLRNASKVEAASKISLSSLALGSVTFGLSGLLHAQNANLALSAANTPKPKATRASSRSDRWRAVRLASNSTEPSAGGGAAPVAQNAPAGAAAGASSPAPATSAAEGAQTLQEIVVTGIRGSLERALQIKKLSLGVVDAVSAEDIGQFPDASIGEAVGRIPGVTVNRGSINQMASSGAATATGSVTGVTVRGFADQFNELLVEGRPIASGNGQTFDFSTMSANYIGEIDVHKTPDMGLSSGAIGASVNVKFPNPFDNPGMHVQAFGSATDFELDGAARPAFGALFSDTLAGGKFGILIDGDYTDHHVLTHHQDIVGWKAANLPCSGFDQNYTTVFGSTGCTLLGAAAAAADAAASTASGTSVTTLAKTPAWYPQDMAMYLERVDSRRKDGRLSFQWHPLDTVLVTLDDNYSSDDEHADRFQHSTWFGIFPTNGPADVVLDGSGTVTNFTDNGPTDFNSFVANDYIVTNTPGINVTWDVSDDWTAELDADQSVSKLNPNGGYSDVDADTGYGDASNNYSGGLVLSQNNSVLPYWSAVGPNAKAPGSGANISSNYLGLNPYIVGSHVMPLQSQQNSDRIDQVKVDVTWHRDAMKLNFGMQLVDDTWNSKEMDTFTNNYWQLWSGYGPASGNTDGRPLPASLFSPVSVGNWMPGFSGAGNLPTSFLMYSPYAVLNYLITQPINPDWKPSGGFPGYTGGYPALALSPTSVQHVNRKHYSPFVTIEDNVPVGAMTLKVDLGLRYQKTDEDIAGLAAPLESLTWLAPGDPTAYGFNKGPSTWTTAGNSYHYLLPSLDLNLMVTPDVKVRADFSRTETAPNNSQLIPNTAYNGRVSSLNATGNNPKLLPYLGDNYDLGAEWYYRSNDYVSVDGFFKRVTQFPVSSVSDITVPGVIDPAQNSANYDKPAVFTESSFVNGLAANVTGVEVIWQQMLPYGFGFQINGTYVHTNANFNPLVLAANQFALPGIGNSANFIGFYQKGPLQARVTVQWQAAQLVGLGFNQGQEQDGGSYAPEPAYQAASTTVDFSTQYEITRYMSAYFEALNLTDTVYHTYGRFTNQTLNLIDYGRSYSLGVRVKF